jgi:hypothetical protein
MDIQLSYSSREEVLGKFDDGQKALDELERAGSFRHGRH